MTDLVITVIGPLCTLGLEAVTRDEARVVEAHNRLRHHVRATIVATLRAHQRTEPITLRALLALIHDKVEARDEVIRTELEALTLATPDHPEPLVIESSGPHRSRLFSAAEVEGWSHS